MPFLWLKLGMGSKTVILSIWGLGLVGDCLNGSARSILSSLLQSCRSGLCWLWNVPILFYRSFLLFWLVCLEACLNLVGFESSFLLSIQFVVWRINTLSSLAIACPDEIIYSVALLRFSCSLLAKQLRVNLFFLIMRASCLVIARVFFSDLLVVWLQSWWRTVVSVALRIQMILSARYEYPWISNLIRATTIFTSHKVQL